MSVLIQLRRDTASNWASINPTLAQGEPGYETDTGKIKYGDGSTAWNSLDYAKTGGIVDGTVLDAAVNANAAIAGTKIDPDFGSQTVETTGVFSAAGGAQATPSITFTGDLNTGIYSPGADQVAISTGGTGRLFVDDSGNVGIGETDPQALLHITSSSGDAEIRLEHPGDTNADRAAITKVESDESLQIKASLGTGERDITFFTSSITEAARISDGRLLVGMSTAKPVASMNATAQIEGTTNATSALSITRNATGAGGAFLNFGKTGGASVGSNDIVDENDSLGSIRFAGADGNDLQSYAAEITAEVDGTPGASVMPGRLVFSTTADGGSSPTERMRINKNGTVVFKNGVKETVYTLGTTGTIALDPSNGSIQSSVLTGAPTFTHSLASGQTIVLHLEGGATYTVTWPTITWVTSGGNAAPTLTAKDTLVLWKVSTTLYGAYVGSYV